MKFATLAGLALVLAMFGPAAAGAEPIEVTASQVVLNLEKPGQRKVGRLHYLGGLKLSSPDDRFGGLSGLTFDGPGWRLTAVSDHGYWFRARLVADAEGAPQGIAEATLAPILDAKGKPVRPPWSDAEAVERAPDGAYLVTFERRHRLARYGPATDPTMEKPVPITTPKALANAPRNGGLEAFAILGPDRFLAVTEEFRDRNGYLMGWLIAKGRARPLAYATKNLFLPTDFAVLPDGDVLVLERRYTPISGAGARLVRLSGGTVLAGIRLEGRELARLVPPLTVDNMEGLAVRQGADGATLVYMLSDDNYNRLLQATLLLAFRLEE
jgi:hypothetical protein